MIIERTFDYELVDSILTHPEIYKTIAPDHAPSPKEFKATRHESVLYLIGTSEKGVVGLFTLKPKNRYVYHGHVQVLPEMRKEYSIEFGESLRVWIEKNTIIKRVSAEIPHLYPNVKDFALKMGFEIEGINRKSYLKHGELHDQWYLGLLLGR